MTDNHPITPPPELVEQWYDDSENCVTQSARWGADQETYIITQAARWGADQELEACVEWLREARNHGFGYDHGAVLAGKLRAARRPKPPSLKERLSKAIIDGDEKEALKLLEQLDD